ASFSYFVQPGYGIWYMTSPSYRLQKQHIIFLRENIQILKPFPGPAAYVFIAWYVILDSDK
ncbi:hypothetical protein KHU47_29085, partial [Bacillus cereus]|nr:hypothetical protein [Bacillus cereus]